MLMNANESALLIIDVQEKLMPAIHDGANVLTQNIRLATIASLLGLPVIATEQTPEKLGPNHPDIKRLCDRTLAKTHFDACVDGLPATFLPACKEVVVSGCEAHVCMLQTAMTLLQNGYRVWVVTDATGSRKTADRDAAFARLRGAGAVPVTLEMVAYEWLGQSSHPQFREVLKLVK
ncbi:isochorismatase family protein [Herbaspirillum lusitanum]|uniref:isochorismatase family protein n=1 Tax=Herbaspirillum lusitanum TaxID=213312 RepID=UPI000305CD8C|nr:isochorismatase family protein [Herbaspirillum lusitanum]